MIIYTAVVLGIGLSLFLFVFLPTFLVGFIKPIYTNFFLRNLSEGVVRIALLLLYMGLTRKVPDVHRLFRYRFHPRCGTSFLLVVVIVSVLVNSVVKVTNTFGRIGCHLLLLPVVVGISYEINRWCGLHDNLLSAVLSAPGKWLQRITTAEPDDSMIECAIRAIELVIPEEKGSDEWGK